MNLIRLTALDAGMKRYFVFVCGCLLCSAAASGRSTAPLSDPPLLNIGFICKWEKRCIERQKRAMKRSIYLVRTRAITASQLQQCSRNASRRGTRVDWVGFENCIENRYLRAAGARQRRRTNFF
jgi:hypothetical protein